MAARHVVVDGSNLATEGRSMPSLAQLDQAVREFLLENPDDIVTVVVDASFGHRIEASEFKLFEDAEAAGEVVSPPAGAIGRGDAFLLRIADKTGATVLSNDSFQEFHGDFEWLFDRGRLIGGKPVPGVGWIFTPRTPVRGPKSREAVKEAKRKSKGETESAMPGLDLAAERSRTKGKGKKSVERAIAVALEEAVAPNAKSRRHRKSSTPPAEPVNDPLTFITFIASHPLGATVAATVDSFASHGAFVDCAGARCYVPLSAMGDPPPKAARELFTKGQEVALVVQALDPLRRGVELAVPGFAKIAGAPTDETVEAEIASHDESDGVAAPPPAGEGATVGAIGAGATQSGGAAGPARRSTRKAAGARRTAKAPPVMEPATSNELADSELAASGRESSESSSDADSTEAAEPSAPARKGRARRRKAGPGDAGAVAVAQGTAGTGPDAPAAAEAAEPSAPAAAPSAPAPKPRTRAPRKRPAVHSEATGGSEVQAEPTAPASTQDALAPSPAARRRTAAKRATTSPPTGAPGPQTGEGAAQAAVAVGPVALKAGGNWRRPSRAAATTQTQMHADAAAAVSAPAVAPVAEPPAAPAAAAAPTQGDAPAPRRRRRSATSGAGPAPAGTAAGDAGRAGSPQPDANEAAPRAAAPARNRRSRSADPA